MILKERCSCFRVPTADKDSGRVSSPRTPSCLVKRSSHRLAFTPELSVKRPRCSWRLQVSAGNARQHPSVPPPASAPGSAAPSAARARCASLLGGYSRAGKEYLHPRQKRSSPPQRGRSEAASRSSLSFPHANEPVPRLLAQVCSAFVSLDYQWGLGRGPKASR